MKTAEDDLSDAVMELMNGLLDFDVDEEDRPADTMQEDMDSKAEEGPTALFDYIMEEVIGEIPKSNKNVWTGR
jgi:hypothetical protein